MKKKQLIIIIIFIFYFTAHAMASDKLYVTDSFKITLRTGPSTENKIIRNLKSGQELDVLEKQENWSHVKVSLEDGTKLEGWVLNRYLMDRMPYEDQAKALFSENERLKDKLSKVSKEQVVTEKDKKEVSAQYNETLSELTALKKDHESLRKASSEFLTLKANYDENLLKLKTTEEKLNEIELENYSIKKSKNYLLFGTGALVLLFGFIIGSMVGRQSKKRSSSYF